MPTAFEASPDFKSAMDEFVDAKNDYEARGNNHPLPELSNLFYRAQNAWTVYYDEYVDHLDVFKNDTPAFNRLRYALTETGSLIEQWLQVHGDDKNVSVAESFRTEIAEILKKQETIQNRPPLQIQF